LAGESDATLPRKPHQTAVGVRGPLAWHRAHERRWPTSAIATAARVPSAQKLTVGRRS
jgi:hypothetical protein